jgi:hypothetical protein
MSVAELLSRLGVTGFVGAMFDTVGGFGVSAAHVAFGVLGSIASAVTSL